jgi:hypothetical protein
MCGALLAASDPANGVGGSSWDDIGVQEPASTFPVLPAATGPLPAAVLHHTGSDVADHFDVLLAVRTPAGPDDRACATWRTPRDPGSLAVDERLAAERIADHRADYLGLRIERELDRGRGRVTPVRHGTWSAAAGSADIELRWHDGTGTVLRATPDGTWTRIR